MELHVDTLLQTVGCVETPHVWAHVGSWDLIDAALDIPEAQMYKGGNASSV